MTQLYAIVPVGHLDDGRPDNSLPGGGGSGNRPDNSLPGGGRDNIWGRPGVDHPSNRPIYHPGHPDHGLPGGGHVGNQLPWSPGNPDNSLPVPPGVTPPSAPPELAAKLVVLWRLPNTVEWHGKAIDPSLVAGQLPTEPTPTPV